MPTIDIAQPAHADERAAILDAARQPVSEALGRPPVLLVRSLNHSGDWVFLLANLQDRGGAPFDFSGTPKAELARQGLVSHSYAALLRKTAGSWKMVECAIGPTDVAWAGWAAKYRLPAVMFRVQ